MPDALMPSRIRIVVLQRGWVVVGRFTQLASECVLEDGAVIRIWGTKNGLAELADGPKKTTVLDKSKYPIRYHEMTAVLSIDCEDSEWEAALK
jgi:hypothetical protein